jgi:hypothetical protein
MYRKAFFIGLVLCAAALMTVRGLESQEVFQKPTPPPSPSIFPAPPQIFEPAPKIAQIVPTKNIWSIQIEQVDAKNVVKATIAKKYDIKIVCEQVEMESQKGVLQARGKVEISDNSIECRCENLTIRLDDDRLLLRGQAQVKISMGPEATTDITGEQLAVRWPDLARHKLKVDSKEPPRLHEPKSPEPKLFEPKLPEPK